ncbi:hypothetical protein FCM35_KLT04481 [Carex littledalei]|uniref:Uncharacterized protein n=1 Tax=Carex littledalei TaxID=544730 RepID=A0A833R1I8_9POAL|nr:hypothetical protein FCM35_KLT04481 [Carex littledalei]
MYFVFGDRDGSTQASSIIGCGKRQGGGYLDEIAPDGYYLVDTSNLHVNTKRKVRDANELGARSARNAEQRKRRENKMNCAHLENSLHEAREEVRMNKCAAERRATEYQPLRSFAIKIHSLFERLRGCITAPGMPGLAYSICSLSLSLSSSSKKDEGDEFHQCIKVQ